MKSLVNTIIAISVMTLGLEALPCSAFEINHQAYQAEYKLTGSAGTSTHLMSFDGKGMGRSEMINSRGSSRNVSIIDYGKRKVTILMPAMKTAMTIDLTDDQLTAFGSVGDKLKATGKPLGTRTIQGHPCTGMRYTLDGGGVQEIWNGNDIGGVRVYSKVVTPGSGVTEASLVKFSPVAPPSSAFAVPAGYSVN